MKRILNKCTRAAAVLIPITAAVMMPAAAADWPARSDATPITQARGYVNIPDVAVPRDPAHVYKALFDAISAPKDPAKPHDVFVRVGSLVNALAQGGVPAANIRFALIFHGPSVDALLTDERYRAKYQMANPNRAIITELRRVGVEIFVCGQYMAGTNLPREALIPNAEVAESATLVTMRYANDGYAIFD